VGIALQQNWGKKVEGAPLKTAFDHWSKRSAGVGLGLYL
jgi:hypothetical protein